MGKYNTIKQNLTQVALIVFSVVLGLYLSERIEERKERKESYELLTTIKSELKDNINLVENWASYHQEINKNLDSLSKSKEFIAEFVNDKFVFFEKLVTKGTFMGRSPANDAWDIAKSHPLIMKIEHDKLIILSKVYNQQKISFEPMLEMFELFRSKDVNKKEDAESNLELISNHLFELVALERQLMFYYKEAEEVLDLQIDRGIDD